MSEIRYMLDASALLALMLDEEGAEVVHAPLSHARVSALNLSEVAAKLQERGVPDEVITASLAELDLLPYLLTETKRCGPNCCGSLHGRQVDRSAIAPASQLLTQPARSRPTGLGRRSIFAFRSRSHAKPEAAA